MVTDVFGFNDVPTKLWVKRLKVKVTALYGLIGVLVRMLGSKVTAGGGTTVGGSPSSSIYTVSQRKVHFFIFQITFSKIIRFTHKNH